jgi:hypothetical protein
LHELPSSFCCYPCQQLYHFNPYYWRNQKGVNSG